MNGETKQADPIPPVAAQILEEASLSASMMFTVTDIADAMILARLFTELFAHGCTLVTTSNVVRTIFIRTASIAGSFCHLSIC